MNGRFLNSLEELEDYMQEKGERVWSIPGGFRISPIIRGKTLTRLEIKWVEEYSVVRFTLGLPIHVPEERQEAMALLATRLNHRLALRGFLGAAGIAFVTHALLNHDGTISTWVIDRSIELCVGAADKYYDVLNRTAKGEPEPDLDDADEVQEVADESGAVVAQAPPNPVSAPERVEGDVETPAGGEQHGSEPGATAHEESAVSGKLHARSVAEEHLYLTLHPCACGQSGTAGLNHGVRNDGDDLVSYYAGPCPRCGQGREILFVLPEKPVSRGSFGGAEPSRIITPAEFLQASDAAARRIAADPSGLPLEERARARAELLRAITYLEEAMKFIPAGQPETVHRPTGTRLSRARLDARLAAYRGLLSGYGSC